MPTKILKNPAKQEVNAEDFCGIEATNILLRIWATTKKGAWRLYVNSTANSLLTKYNTIEFEERRARNGLICS